MPDRTALGTSKDFTQCSPCILAPDGYRQLLYASFTSIDSQITDAGLINTQWRTIETTGYSVLCAQSGDKFHNLLQLGHCNPGAAPTAGMALTATLHKPGVCPAYQLILCLPQPSSEPCVDCDDLDSAPSDVWRKSSSCYYLMLLWSLTSQCFSKMKLRPCQQLNVSNTLIPLDGTTFQFSKYSANPCLLDGWSSTQRPSYFHMFLYPESLPWWWSAHKLRSIITPLQSEVD